MSRKSTQHDKQFKPDTLKYIQEHPDLTQEECCKNLGISLSTLSRWKSQYAQNDGDIPTRGSGNYASDEQKEIARLKRELHDSQDALDVLKKPSALWENLDIVFFTKHKPSASQQRKDYFTIYWMNNYHGSLLLKDYRLDPFRLHGGLLCP